MYSIFLFLKLASQLLAVKQGHVHEGWPYANSTMLKQAVQSEGCQLAEVDFETRTLKIDGPDEVAANCARAVADIID
jgi:hypothetical protein